MYKIIGADQKEYGPVSADQIKAWILEGRAGGQTLIQMEGSAEWKPLSSLPEFAQQIPGESSKNNKMDRPRIATAIRAMTN